MNFLLANGQTVEASVEEVKQFVTGPVAISNPYWRHSGALTLEELTRFLKRGSSQQEVEKVADYILRYAENAAFCGYLFDKTDGEPERTKEFNLPVLQKLRRLNQKPITWEDAWEMENLCMGIGLDPL